ncbi:hypothetical protein U27_01570 [Candidatus Vecturithrix granuli]|uniref:Uncharacterized protein n=1 Tax=Vecturithrix granuli TaxID=1499967 RepID=A0A081CAR4_VECG1|nr:hypothetical protein U27_01570 [Candidatus Vecturithrix granuli]
MNVPSTHHQAWKDLLTGKQHYDFESFAVQMIVKRLSLKVSQHPSPEILSQSMRELREMFVQNVNAPKIQRDLHKLFRKEELQ